MISSEDTDKEGEAVSGCVGEDLSHSFESVLKELPEVVNYIKRLNEHIKRQQNVLLRLYEKLKEYKSRCEVIKDSRAQLRDIATQTDDSSACPQEPAPAFSDTTTERNDSSEWQAGGFSGNSLAEEVKKAAENAMQQTGFVYEETSGMYYDYNTGYYYNAELGLYYDGHSGTYLFYNEATSSYEFHSQAATPVSEQLTGIEISVLEASTAASAVITATPSCTSNNLDLNEDKFHHRSKRKLKEEKKLKKRTRGNSPSRNSDGSAEEGECSDSSSNNDESESKMEEDAVDSADNETRKTLRHSSKQNYFEKLPCKQEICVPESGIDESAVEKKSKKTDRQRRLSDCKQRRYSDEANAAWPPCMRIMVQSTDVKSLSVGTLFIVTCKGGTLGRQKSHAVCIPDINISKHHGKFTFDEQDGGKYFLTDYGSRNGTYVNQKRLSAAKQESEPCEISHGTIITLGSTDLLCHIHPGRETCENCEPGVIAAKLAEDQEILKPISKHGENKSAMRKLELKRLRKRFGLESSESKGDLLGAGYEDRAEIRRSTVGSQNEHAKTETASVTESIKSTNKGFAMLSKMGWKEGDSLGKDGTGLTEPVLVSQRAEKAGLGADWAASACGESDSRAKRRADMWVRAQQRYGQLKTSGWSSDSEAEEEEQQGC